MNPSRVKFLPFSLLLATSLFPAGEAWAGSILYVTNYSNNTVSAIDSSGNVSTFVSSGLNGPTGLAFDSAGDLLVANLQDKNSTSGIVAVSPSGTVTPYAYLNDYPGGIALDSSGNLYVSNPYGDTVSKVTGPFPSGGTSNIAVVASGIPLVNVPQALAFDSTGNLFLVSSNYAGVAELSGGTLASFVSSNLFSGADGIAIDASNDLYVSNYNNNTILEVTPVGGISTYATGLNGPAGLAFDSSGDLFVANDGTNSIDEIAPGGGTPTVFATGLNNPQFLAFSSNVSSTPEPASLCMFCAGGVVLLLRRRFRRHQV